MIVNSISSPEYPDDIWLLFFANQGASANIAILQDARDTAYLYDVCSSIKRKGHGSALIREIDEYCLVNRIMLIVEAEPYDTGDNDHIVNRDQLKTWYEKNGATFIEYNENENPVLLLGNHTLR